VELCLKVLEKKIEEALFFVYYIFQREKLCIRFDKNWVGLHFGRFLTNSSLNKVANDTNASVPGLPDFFGTKYQNGEKYTK
jgi:hypothetical protein